MLLFLPLKGCVKGVTVNGERLTVNGGRWTVNGERWTVDGDGRWPLNVERWRTLTRERYQKGNGQGRYGHGMVTVTGENQKIYCTITITISYILKTN